MKYRDPRAQVNSLRTINDRLRERNRVLSETIRHLERERDDARLMVHDLIQANGELAARLRGLEQEVERLRRLGCA